MQSYFATVKHGFEKTQICNCCRCKVKINKVDVTNTKIAKYSLDKWADPRVCTPIDTVRQQLKLFSGWHNLYVKTEISL